jgi:hypothetical protein
MFLRRLKIEHGGKRGVKGDNEIRNLGGYRVGVLLVPSLIDDNFKYFHRTSSMFVIKLTVGCCFSINIKSFHDI